MYVRPATSAENCCVLYTVHVYIYTHSCFFDFYTCMPYFQTNGSAYDVISGSGSSGAQYI